MFYAYVDGLIGYRKLRKTSMHKFIRVVWDKKALEVCKLRLKNLTEVSNNDVKTAAQSSDESKKLTGVMFCTGHIGSWEIGIHPPAIMGLPSIAIARPLDAYLLDAEVNRMRNRFGNKTLSKFGAFAPMLKAILAGKNIGLVIDQEAGVKSYGLYVQFLREWSKSIDPYATVHLKYGAPIIPAFVIREGERYKFTLYMTEPIELEGSYENPKDLYKIVQLWHDRFAVFVLKFPAQYEWYHEKWRTRPASEKNVPEPSKDIQPRREEIAELQLWAKTQRTGNEIAEQFELTKHLFENLPEFGEPYPF